MRTYNAPGNYVTANVQPNEIDPLMEHALTSGLERDVIVPVLQNAAGGLGVFVAMAAGGFYLGFTSDLSELLILPAVAGLITFGAACAFRAFRDEAQAMLYHWSRGWAEGRTNKDLDFFREETGRLHAEVRQLSTINAQMVKNVRASTGAPADKPKAIQDEYTEPLRDAGYLCRFHDSHGTIAREKVMGAGQLTKSRWEAARQLLIDSGVPINGGVLGVPAVLAIGSVREFVDKQRGSPTGFVQPSA